MENFFDILREQLGLSKDAVNPKFKEKEVSMATLSVDPIEHLYKDILYTLDSQKVFLDPDISLIKLSSIIGTNTTYLSNAINKYFRCNFKTLINKYRIEYCKNILNTDTSILSVKEMAKTCGFASVSAFYASFKKVTGVSPLQYKVIVRFKDNLFDVVKMDK